MPLAVEVDKGMHPALFVIDVSLSGRLALLIELFECLVTDWRFGDARSNFIPPYCDQLRSRVTGESRMNHGDATNATGNVSVSIVHLI